MILDKLKLLYAEVNSHPDLSYKSIPFFVKTVREIRIELQKISTEQAEQISRDVSDAMRLIRITEREDLNNIQNYPKEIPKYLGRLKATLQSSLAFVDK